MGSGPGPRLVRVDGRCPHREPRECGARRPRRGRAGDRRVPGRDRAAAAHARAPLRLHQQRCRPRIPFDRGGGVAETVRLPLGGHVRGRDTAPWHGRVPPAAGGGRPAPHTGGRLRGRARTTEARGIAMCGIAGELRLEGGPPIGVERVRAMCDVMTHRGPDDFGAFTTADVALGMRRLSIVDVAGGHQPLANEDGTVQVVCNGEIYNAPKLAAELMARGHNLRTRSDVEVIAHLYEEEGVRAVERLDGMFAIALWDARRRRLVLARDRAGIKPPYIAAIGRAPGR